ncbi:MAG: hypothetical protein K0R47_2145, partial [Brevibacillus sp.]|nr:hypothetical protein [Brevibacillus sp.]
MYAIFTLFSREIWNDLCLFDALHLL